MELDVLPRRELAVAMPERVRDLADRAQLRGSEVPAGELDAEHERSDLRLVVVEAPPLEADHVLLGNALVTSGDECRQLVANSERRLLLLQALDGVALEHEIPVGLGLWSARSSGFDRHDSPSRIRSPSTAKYPIGHPSKRKVLVLFELKKFVLGDPML